MKARMKDNLLERYERSELKGELAAIRNEHGEDAYQKTVTFLESIEGEVVELRFTLGDAFVVGDPDGYWLPSSLWEPLAGGE